MVSLEFEEEVFPLLTKAMCDIVPQAFYSGVVNAPMVSS